jgi:2-methylfumaryl-CoA hydratase
MSAPKATRGNFFEDFHLGQVIRHAVPRTITTGDVALFSALYGMRYPLQSSAAFARTCGLPGAPLDDMLVLHVIFGKTVPDISLNAVANLGYAELTFGAPLYPGASVTADSQVIGLRENSNGKTGIVYVRSTGHDENGRVVVSFVRWVMVQKRDPSAPAPETVVPDLSSRVAPADLRMPDGFDAAGYDIVRAGSPHLWEDYTAGEWIDHIDGMTVEEAEHQTATRLYQNTARGHFDALTQSESRFRRRIVYGGHVMTLARSLAFNGLANAGFVAAINSGRHVSPVTAGDTIYAGTQVLETHDLDGQSDLGALRVRTIATRNMRTAPPDGDALPEGAVLDVDWWLLMPRGGR